MTIQKQKEGLIPPLMWLMQAKETVIKNDALETVANRQLCVAVLAVIIYAESSSIISFFVVFM